MIGSKGKSSEVGAKEIDLDKGIGRGCDEEKGSMDAGFCWGGSRIFGGSNNPGSIGRYGSMEVKGEGTGTFGMVLRKSWEGFGGSEDEERVGSP